jgi:hypothetical protein
MAEPRDTDALVKRISMAAALALSAAVVAVPYAVGRMFRRWQEGISPLAGLRARVGSAKKRSERRREAAGASVQVLRNVRRGRPGWTPSGNIPSERR